MSKSDWIYQELYQLSNLNTQSQFLSVSNLILQVMIILSLYNVRKIVLITLFCLFLWKPAHRKARRRLKTALDEYYVQTYDHLENEIDSIIGIPKFPQVCRSYYFVSTVSHILNLIINTILVLRLEESLTGGNFFTCVMFRCAIL